MNISASKIASRVVSPLLLVLAMVAGSAQATPVAGTVINDNSMFTVVHLGATPGGSGDRDDWFWFDDNQPLLVQLLGGTDVSLSGPQSFSVTSNNGTGDLLISRLDLDLNDLTDGFLYGEMDYTLTSNTSVAASGTFTFENQNYNSIFNTSSYDGENLEFFLWGGDQQNALGIDFAFRGKLEEVPVPGSALLLVIAIAALRGARKLA